MRRSNKPRLYGPYLHGETWRIHIVRPIVVGGRRTRQTTYEIVPSREYGEALVAGARDEAQGVTVGQAVTAYLDQLKLDERAPATIESAEDRLERLLGLPANKSRPIRWLNRRGVELYDQARKGCASDTHINALHVGKTWGEFCVERRWLRVNPFKSVKKVGRKALGADKPKHNTNESRRLYDYCREHSDDQGAVLTLGYLLLGSRASELVKRTIRDLDDDGRVLEIGKTKTAKGQRRLAIPAELQEMLTALAVDRPGSAPIFAHEDGRPWSRFTARLEVKRIQRAAGVPDLGPQALRRTQATLATEASESALAVANHLGHTSTAITARAYVDPNAAKDAQVARSLRVIAGGKR